MGILNDICSSVITESQQRPRSRTEVKVLEYFGVEAGLQAILLCHCPESFSVMLISDIYVNKACISEE